MAIFNSYVSLPEGNFWIKSQYTMRGGLDGGGTTNFHPSFGGGEIWCFTQEWVPSMAEKALNFDPTGRPENDEKTPSHPLMNHRFPCENCNLVILSVCIFNNSAGESPFSTRQSTFQTILKYYVYIYICTMLVCWLCKYSVESQKLTFLGVSTAGFDHVRLKTSILGIRSMKKNMIRIGSVTVRSQLYNLPR